jgi:serine/threonine protein kinase
LTRSRVVPTFEALTFMGTGLAMIGETLGNYKLVAKLGSGSMGVVFLAEHQRIARQVAIKLLPPELCGSPQVLQRFFNEARATSLIRHPGIVDVFDCDVDAAGRAFIVMDHLVGETLADRLERTETLPWREACAIAAQVADALGAAHGQRIVHRDLKPDNVFLVGEAPPVVKVFDFGIAKLQMGDPRERLTMRGMLLGTPEYMSPEQCGGSTEVDHRADIYALGCILFEMLTGTPPFLAETIKELIIAHQFRSPPALADEAPAAPAWLADLLARMLAKQPGDRPASMDDVARDLRAHEPEGSLASAPAERVAPPKPWSVEIVAWPKPWRAEIAIGLAGALALAGALWLAVRSPAPSRAEQTPVSEPVRQAEAQPPPPPASAVVLPTATRPLETPVAARPLPPERKPTQAAARPALRVRPAARQTQPQSRHPVDTDGIVDL